MSIPAQRGVEPERPHFDMVLRGYDRIEVDAYIDKLLGENAALRDELENSATRYAAPAEQEHPEARPEQPVHHYDVETPAEDSFGFRAEKLLRLAERESAEMRTRATRDAEAVEAAARRRAEEQVRAAEQQAAQVREQATREASQLKKAAGQEAQRVGFLHRNTKDELRRLAALLNAELERPDPQATGPQEQGPEPQHPENSGAPASNH